jgi:hypothetical protein
MQGLTFNEQGLLIGTIPAECVQECSSQGSVDAAVEYWVNRLHFDEAITPVRDKAIAYLRDYGAWEDLDRADDETLAQRILWTACCDVKENGEPWLGLTH